MSFQPSSELVAMGLASIWSLHKKDAFRDYLAGIFCRPFSSQIHFCKLFITEAEEGDINSGCLYGMKEWWEVDDNGMRISSRPAFLTDPDDERHVFGEFYITPFIRFFWENTRVLIGEAYSPEMVARTVADMSIQAGQMVFLNRRVVWLSPSARRRVSM